MRRDSTQCNSFKGGFLVSREEANLHLVFLTNLEDIVPRFHICDVNPLAVDICVVGIITSWAQALHIRQHQHKSYINESYTRLFYVWNSNWNLNKG